MDSPAPVEESLFFDEHAVGTVTITSLMESSENQVFDGF